MRTTKSLIVGAAVTAFALAFGTTGVARADVSTERPGSILIFPKVVNTTDQDTIIQITNVNNDTRHARCFFVDGALTFDPTTGLPRPSCQESDFSIWLTRLQPTHWQVSVGRRIDPTDNFSSAPGYPSTAGFDPGGIPPVGVGFTGALICAEVDASDKPIAGNSLTGQATVKNINTGDVSKYNGITIQGITPMGQDLSLDNVEYNGCPASLNLTTISSGAPDPVVEALSPNTPSTVRNFITLMPCGADLENLVSQTVSLQVAVFNEFEQRVSLGGPSVECWARLPLEAIGGGFNFATAGTTFTYGTITPQGANAANGILGVADSVATDSLGNSGSAADNLHVAGNTDTTNLPVVTGSPAVIRLSVP